MRKQVIETDYIQVDILKCPVCNGTNLRISCVHSEDQEVRGNRVAIAFQCENDCNVPTLSFTDDHGNVHVTWEG